MTAQRLLQPCQAERYYRLSAQVDDYQVDCVRRTYNGSALVYTLADRSQFILYDTGGAAYRNSDGVMMARRT